MEKPCNHCFCRLQDGWAFKKTHLKCCKCGLTLHKYNEEEQEFQERKRSSKRLSNSERKSYGLPPDASQRYM